LRARGCDSNTRKNSSELSRVLPSGSAILCKTLLRCSSSAVVLKCSRLRPINRDYAHTSVDVRRPRGENSSAACFSPFVLHNKRSRFPLESVSRTGERVHESERFISQPQQRRFPGFHIHCQPAHCLSHQSADNFSPLRSQADRNQMF
jgi:hypothetical protein